MADARELIAAALSEYHCAHTSIDDGEGTEGLPLVDKLTPPEQTSIDLGLQELNALADHIADALADELADARRWRTLCVNFGNERDEATPGKPHDIRITLNPDGCEVIKADGSLDFTATLAAIMDDEARIQSGVPCAYPNCRCQVTSAGPICERGSSDALGVPEAGKTVDGAQQARNGGKA